MSREQNIKEKVEEMEKKVKEIKVELNMIRWAIKKAKEGKILDALVELRDYCKIDIDSLFEIITISVYGETICKIYLKENKIELCNTETILKICEKLLDEIDDKLYKLAEEVEEEDP